MDNKKMELYNEISRLLTEYEESSESITKEEFYKLLVYIQNNYDDITKEE